LTKFVDCSVNFVKSGVGLGGGHFVRLLLLEVADLVFKSLLQSKLLGSIPLALLHAQEFVVCQILECFEPLDSRLDVLFNWDWLPTDIIGLH